ncbi:MAG: hypothetical protein ACHQ1G_12200 [Planctomycetota bacterium]
MRRGGLLLLLGAALWAGPPTGAGAFEDGLKVVQGLLERGQCAEGKKRLAKLLEEHPKAPYVLGRRVQLEELARQLAFGIAIPPVDPKELISGELVQWNARDGTIKLRYKGGADMQDWQKGGAVLVHPAPFRGPHSITIKGQRYPTDTTALVIVCWSDEKNLAVVPGLAATTTHMSIPARIELQRGEDLDTIGGGGDSPVDGGRAFTISVVVNATQVSCNYAGRAIARANKASDHWGSVAIGNLGECEIVLSGKIEPSWIQGLVDKERQQRLGVFSRRWEPKDDLPAWLFEAGPSSVLDEPDMRDWPMEVDERGAKLINRAMDREA